MPYSRPGHRRSFSSDAPNGPFVSLGPLPRRTPPSLPSKFHLHRYDDEDDDDDDDDTTSSSDELEPVLKLAVPFPTSVPSPLRSTPPFAPELASRPSPSRTSSTPILLSNGKPLKSSLKGSNSSPSIAGSISHLRAASAPSTPNPTVLSSVPSTPKNVHFPNDNLTTVRLFNRSAKPISLLSEETETETETDAPLSSGVGYPFPMVPAASSSSSPRPNQTYTLDLSANPLPNPRPDLYANVYLESLTLSSQSPLSLQGYILLRNISYEKHASVRFTFDGWVTTSEVSARYVESLSTPPPSLLSPSTTIGDLLAREKSPFDRFQFTIALEDYLPRGNTSHPSNIPLLQKKLVLAVRYCVPGKGEWWDNCGGRNWTVAFVSDSNPLANRERSVSAPISPPASIGFHGRISSDPGEFRRARDHVLESRLKGLRLSNYAAPVPPSPTPTSTALQNDGGIPFPTITVTSSPQSQPLKLGNLHWPWGNKADSSPSTLPPPAPPASSSVEVASTNVVAGASDSRRERSDSTSSTYSSSSEDSLATVGDGPLPLPLPSPSAVPQEPRQQSWKAMNTSLDSDLLYKAFVKKWCFGGSPSPTSPQPLSHPEGIEA